MNSRRIQDSNKHYKMILEHRYVWERYNGMCLLPWSIVHHIDGDIENNDPMNLQAMMRHHHTKTFPNKIESGRLCSVCGTSKTTIGYKRWARWYRDPMNIDKFLCHKCYRRCNYQKNERVD